MQLQGAKKVWLLQSAGIQRILLPTLACGHLTSIQPWMQRSAKGEALKRIHRLSRRHLRKRFAITGQSDTVDGNSAGGRSAEDPSLL